MYILILLFFKKSIALDLCAILQLRIDIYCIRQLSRVLSKIVNILKLNYIVR